MVLIPPAFANYDINQPGCSQIGANNDVPSLACLAQTIANVIGIAFLFLGFITLVFLLLGAIKFITSRGDPKAIQGAQKTMTYAIIGAVLILLSFAIINIITTALGFPNILTTFTFFQSN